MKLSVNLIVFACLVLAALGYCYGLYSAYDYSIQGIPNDMPGAIRRGVIGIGGILATNFGAVFGIEVKKLVNDGFGNTPFLFRARAASNLQMIAAYLYFISLLFGYAWWGFKFDFTEDPEKIVVVIPQLAQTLYGVVIGLVVINLDKK